MANKDEHTKRVCSMRNSCQAHTVSFNEPVSLLEKDLIAGDVTWGRLGCFHLLIACSVCYSWAADARRNCDWSWVVASMRNVGAVSGSRSGWSNKHYCNGI